MIFQELPQELQDSLRDAPITAIENGRIYIEILGNYKGQLHQLNVSLQPRSMDPNAIIYVTQDLQDVEVSMMAVQQVLPA